MGLEVGANGREKVFLSGPDGLWGQAADTSVCEQDLEPSVRGRVRALL